MKTAATSAHKKIVLALRRTKTAEIVFADKHGARLLHRGKLKVVVNPAHAPIHQRRTHPRITHHVHIAAGQRRETRMEIVGNGSHPLHRNAVGQQGIQAPHPGLGPAQRGGVDMHHLAQCMHAGVGAPRANRGDGLRHKAAQSRFQGVLH